MKIDLPKYIILAALIFVVMSILNVNSCNYANKVNGQLKKINQQLKKANDTNTDLQTRLYQSQKTISNLLEELDALPPGEDTNSRRRDIKRNIAEEIVNSIGG